VFVSREIKVGSASELFPLFDWLRFTLASVVALTHEHIIGWEPAANLAVQVFFALSGWLIGGILLRTDVRHLSRFYFNRATRIWIPYVFAVAAIYLLAAVRDHPGVPATLHFLTYDLTFTHNWFIDPIKPMPLGGTGAHFWSIAVEEQFYLAAPLLILLTPFGRSIAAWSLIAAAAVLTHSWYGSISLGVLAAVARCRFGDWHLSRISASAVAGVATFALAALIAVPVLYSDLAPLFAIDVVLLTSWPGVRSTVGSFAGGVSYPLYLWHWTGAFAAHALLLPAWSAYLIAVMVGIFAYAAIDRNVMRLRAALYRPSIGKSLMIAAYALLAIGIISHLLWTK
jgi:peptidoglycan/LPS O-acetylase OafA/YrhL